MLPASNRGAGQSLCFPDVCLTPAPPAPPIPVPYPNIGMNAQAQAFAPNVKIANMNALNMGSKISMTSGDEAGAAHPTIKGMGGYTMGNPIVTINKLPAINLTSQANGNMMNAPVGAVLVPSAVNVLFCDASAARTVGGAGAEARCALGDAFAPSARGPVALAPVSAGVAVLRLERVTVDAHVALREALRAAVAEGARGCVIDLRDNPGGDLRAAVGCASAFLPEGAAVVTERGADGDEVVHRARGGARFDGPVAVLVDDRTASAAEVVAGALAAHGRARLVGARTHGKGTAQALGGLRGAIDAGPYATVAELATDHPLDEGVAVDHEADGDRAMDVAIALVRAALEGSEAPR
jgi:carboxyl-terminal processing protease